MTTPFKSILTASLFAAFATVATAQEATPDTWISSGAQSRDQIAAELASARKDGSIKSVSLTYDFVSRSSSLKSRDDVRAETMAAMKSGEIAAMNAEASGFVTAARGEAGLYAQAR